MCATEPTLTLPAAGHEGQVCTWVGGTPSDGAAAASSDVTGGVASESGASSRRKARISQLLALWPVDVGVMGDSRWDPPRRICNAWYNHTSHHHEYIVSDRLKSACAREPQECDIYTKSHLITCQFRHWIQSSV